MTNYNNTMSSESKDSELYMQTLTASGVRALFILLCSCSALAGERTSLTLQELSSSDAASVKLVQNHYFMPAEDAKQPVHRFSGILKIPEHSMHTEPAEIKPAELLGKKTQLFPGVSLAFVSHEGDLLPVNRDMIILLHSDSFWQMQVSPGHVWSEAGDEGMSRASFPFFLTSIIENETYNGIATFVFDDNSVSNLRYQIVQQLSPFMVETHFVASGQPKIVYVPGAIDDDVLIANYKQERNDQLVWRDWSELEKQYGVDLFADFDSGIDPNLVATSGLVIDNEVYVHSMATPYGDYPYPREMRHGVWSATKTLAGLVTLMRMAEKYGDEILDYKIKGYLPVTAPHNGWDEVTFRHALSMATGIGTGTKEISPNNISDGYIYSDFDAYKTWWFAPTNAEKLAELFKVPNHPWGPGEIARYRDRDIYVLAAALDSLYRRKEGDNADMWQMMLDEVYTPLGIHHMPQNTTIEIDRPGVPLLGWGIYVTIDDVAKIGRLLQQGGAYNGKQLLSKAGIAEALYETDIHGLPTGDANEFGTKTYHLSFWHEPYISASGKTYTAPQMRGWGGNVVQLMPNGIIGFRMGNGGYADVEQMLLIADKIRPFDNHRRH